MSDNALRRRVREILQQQVGMASGSSIRGGVYAGARRRKAAPKRRAVGSARKRVVATRRAPAKRTARGGGASKWIAHVKAYARKHGVSYGEAMSMARSSYNPVGGAYAGSRRRSPAKRASRSRGGVVIGASKRAEYLTMAKKLLKMAR